MLVAVVVSFVFVIGAGVSVVITAVVDVTDDVPVNKILVKVTK